MAGLVAALYSSVGHGGASGYLAVMALAGMAPAQMKPTALLLNILVASFGSYRYIRASCFKWSAFWPLALGSIGFAFVGGASAAEPTIYRRILGGALVFAAVALMLPRKDSATTRPVPVLVGVLLGAILGYVSGLIGVGGGIFLSPLLILSGWATTRETLGTSALFILVNSLAGLAGHLASIHDLPPFTMVLAMSAFLGGLIGSEIGARGLPPSGVRLLLAAVLAIASWKLLLS